MGTGLALTATAGLPLEALAAGDLYKLCILHTNDTHSRIDPFPMDGSKHQGKGGVERRGRLIRKVREQEEHVLLLDAGDIFQGTPYFNMFDGALEIQLMSSLGYDASVPGNHDFDKGIDNLATQLGKSAFPMVVTNYGVEDTPLNGITRPYLILERGPIRIGIVGAGLYLDGYVAQSFYKGLRFPDTIETVDRTAGQLKNEHGCHLVICLSHLGYEYDDNTLSDRRLAAATRHVDLIIGGHTHTFLPEAVVLPNRDNKPVIINQAGWGGIVLGRLDIYFEKNLRRRCHTCRNLLVS